MLTIKVFSLVGKRKIYVITVLCLLFNSIFLTNSYSQSKGAFRDVPIGHWAEVDIYRMRDIGVIGGISEELFGLDKQISRAEFVAMITRLVNLEVEKAIEGDFEDVKTGSWYYTAIKQGITSGIILASDYKDNRFEPNKSITREEMAIILVRALGYEFLAQQLSSYVLPFEDVENFRGHIKLARDLGIIKGKDKKSFAPKENATRQEACVMMARIHRIISNNLQTLHGFYAISSYHQREKIHDLNSVGFGWSSLEYVEEVKKVRLTSNRYFTNGVLNDYYLPSQYVEPFNVAVDTDKKVYLMIFADNTQSTFDIPGKEQNTRSGILTQLLSSEENQKELINEILHSLTSMGSINNKISFDGVIIDFEGLFDREGLKENYVSFLKKLSKELKVIGKEMVVCVPPIRTDGVGYFNGYDYRSIGQIADKIILMAHDYSPITLNNHDVQLYQGRFPLAPISQVYDAIVNAVDEENGIPPEKIVLQISLDKKMWEVRDNVPLKRTSSYITYQEIEAILKNTSSQKIIYGLDERTKSPYIFFEDDISGATKIIWYEDGRSVRSKIDLAKHFGLGGISIWRLGIAGDSSHDPTNQYHLNVWQEIESLKQ